MSIKQEAKDLTFLIGLGLAGAGVSRMALWRFMPGSDPMQGVKRGIAQLAGGAALAILVPKKGLGGFVKMAGVGIAMAGGFTLAQNRGVLMLAGRGRRGTSSLSRDQILFLQTQGRAPALSGPAEMRAMSGPAEMRRFNGPGGRPGMMGRSGVAFRASC